MTTFERLNQQQQVCVTDFADFFCENFVINSGGVWYADPAWARRHVETAKMLAIPASRLQLVDIVTAGEPYANIAARRTGWKKKLGIKRSAGWVTVEKRLNRKRIRSGITIRVLAKSGKKASYAFRYAMYLLRIGYWD